MIATLVLAAQLIVDCDAALAGSARVQPPAPPPSSGPTTLVDVLVVYTPSAIAMDPAIVATVNGYADATNAAYATCGVEQRVRLVGVEETAYVESGNSITDLARLKSKTDGHMDSVHALRDAVGADCVVLVATSGSAGVGYQMAGVDPSFEDCAFSTIGHAVGFIPFAHELGHNMGLGHNNGPGASAGAFCYSYGYRTPDDAWRSIMSSSPGAHTGLFSTPLIDVGGFPFGVDGTGCPNDAADAAASLNGTASTVAAWRPTVISEGGFTDLGNGLAGTHGEPLLDGRGSMIGGDPITITLSGALENATAFLLVGFDTLFANFKGGVIVPDTDPPGFILTLGTDAAGSLVLGGTWPTGVPSGVLTYLQVWISDLGGPKKFAASNGLELATP